MIKNIVIFSFAVFLFATLLGLHSFGQGKPNIHITADNFEFDAAHKTMVASGNVVVTQKDIRMTGTTARYDQGTTKVVLQGPVQIVKGELTMTCGYIIAFGAAERVEAYDNVTFTYRALKGQSEKAEYSIPTQRVILSGSPMATQGQDRIVGKQILVDLKTQKIRTVGSAQMVISPESFKSK